MRPSRSALRSITFLTSGPARLGIGLGLVVTALTLALATTVASARGGRPAHTLGVYAGAGKPDAVRRFEKNLGRRVKLVHDTFADDSWNTLSNPNWWLGRWSQTKYADRVVYTVPMLPAEGGTLAEGAAGAYNEHFRLLAARLVAGGQGRATLRIGPEFNGIWFRWTIAVPNGGADFAAYWRQIVATMRAVPGARFKFSWTPTSASSVVDGQPLRAQAAWPGDDVVDHVGLDVYDQSWPRLASPVARWRHHLAEVNGLRWHRRFAGAHRKPMTFPEWGIVHRADGHGGGDNPYFVTKMYQWIRSNNVAYHMYFEHADPNGDYAIFNGKAPKAARRFVTLFGPQGTRATRTLPGRSLR
jgi:hypothetical protein